MLESFITADGPSFGELAGPAWTPARNQGQADDDTVMTGG